MRRGDQPAVLAHALGEVAAGAGQDVVGRLVPGDEIRALGVRAGLEAQEGMQMVRFAAYGLEPSVQLAAVRIAGQHGVPLAPTHSP